VSLFGGRSDVFLLEPVTGAAVAYDDCWVLIDTGFNPQLVRDPELRAAHYTYANYTAVIPPGDPLVDQVRAAGLDWEDLAFCAVSHLHCDHSGGLRLLVDGPPVVIQRREFDFAMNRATHGDVYFRSDYERDGIDWVIVDGDAELAPGLTGLATFGHTPGHMSFSVEFPDRTIVLACDAADLEANITRRIRCGSVAEAGDEAAAQRSIERLAQLASSPNTEVWPGHDPDFWATRQRPPSFYP
jgi:glyoxylase-like metal-dependent hydrolase (beta-lactamase superfamily II)